MDRGAPGRKRKWPKQEASAPNVRRRRPRKRFCREEPWSVGVGGGGTVSGAQGCPDVEQEVTGPPAGHQQPWQRQVSTEGAEAEAGCGGQHDRGGSPERGSAARGGGLHRPGGRGCELSRRRTAASEPLPCRWLRLPGFPHLRDGTED